MTNSDVLAIPVLEAVDTAAASVKQVFDILMTSAPDRVLMDPTVFSDEKVIDTSERVAFIHAAMEAATKIVLTHPNWK